MTSTSDVGIEAGARTRFPATAVRTSVRVGGARSSRVGTRHADRTVVRYRAALPVIDLLAASAAAGAAVWWHQGGATTAARPATLLSALLLPPLWVAVVALNQGRPARVAGVGPAEFERVVRAFLHLTALTALVSFVARSDISLGVAVVALPLTLGLDLSGRALLRSWLHRQRRHGRALSSVLAVGDPAGVATLARALAADHRSGMRVRGACLSPGTADGDGARLEGDDVPVLGRVDAVLEAAHAIGAHTVAVVSSGDAGDLGGSAPARLRTISWQLEGSDVDLLVWSGLAEVACPRLNVRPVAGLALLHVRPPRFHGLPRVAKAAVDRLCAALGLLLLAPLWLGLLVAVRATSHGPALFRQTRIGRDGRPFTMLKFRSMSVGADQRLDDLAQRNVNADGLLFKVPDDPRVTPLGRLLRRWSLDELPQLFNVLAGHMSLVGPRPPLPAEVLRYGDDTRRRLLVKPGLTGLWQISGRSDLSWDESLRLDLSYVENWSLGLDLTILWRTASAVVRGRGAY